MYNSNNAASMAEIDTHRVIDACNRFIESRNKYIEHKHQEYITEKMQSRKWFFGLLTLPGMPKEEAEEAWNNGGDLFTPRQQAELIGLLQYNEVLELLHLAKNTNKPTMFISQSMSFLF